MIDGFIDVGSEFFSLIGYEMFDGSMAAVQVVEKGVGNFHGGFSLERNELDPLRKAFLNYQNVLVTFRGLGKIHHEIAVYPFEWL